jgi:hypothetical protein
MFQQLPQKRPAWPPKCILAWSTEPFPESPVPRTLTFRLPQLLLAGIAAPVVAASAQRSDLAVTPFVSFLPSTGGSPLAGLALTLGGNGGLAFRASGNFALQNTTNSSTAVSTDTRPWGADADAMFLFSRNDGLSRSITPFVFAGVGVEGVQNVVDTRTRNNWSYGFGANVPLARAIDLFGEARWRMTEFVLPTAYQAPARTNELRFGLSFQVGSGTNESAPPRGRRR